MPEEPNELRDTLVRLHQQLRAAHGMSAETRDQLQGIVQEIEALLASAKPATGAAKGLPAGAQASASLVSRLSTAEREFEATHPSLAVLVGSVIDALGKMGI